MMVNDINPAYDAFCILPEDVVCKGKNVLVVRFGGKTLECELPNRCLQRSYRLELHLLYSILNLLAYRIDIYLLIRYHISLEIQDQRHELPYRVVVESSAE